MYKRSTSVLPPTKPLMKASHKTKPTDHQNHSPASPSTPHCHHYWYCTTAAASRVHPSHRPDSDSGPVRHLQPHPFIPLTSRNDRRGPSSSAGSAALNRAALTPVSTSCSPAVMRRRALPTRPMPFRHDPPAGIAHSIPGSPGFRCTGIFPAFQFEGSTTRAFIGQLGRPNYWSGRHRVDPLQVAHTIWLNSSSMKVQHHDLKYSLSARPKATITSLAIDREAERTDHQQLQPTPSETNCWLVPPPKTFVAAHCG